MPYAFHQRFQEELFGCSIMLKMQCQKDRTDFRLARYTVARTYLETQCWELNTHIQKHRRIFNIPNYVSVTSTAGSSHHWNHPWSIKFSLCALEKPFIHPYSTLYMIAWFAPACCLGHVLTGVLLMWVLKEHMLSSHLYLPGLYYIWHIIGTE